MTGNAPSPSLFRRVGAWIRKYPVFWPGLAFLMLLTYNLVFTPNFARIDVLDGRLFGSLVDIVQNGAPVMLLAIGMTLVIATAGIDLSVGSVMALSGAVAALLMTEQGLSVPAAVACALAVSLLAGLVNGALVSLAGLQPIVSTLILWVTARGVAQALTHDQKIRFEEPAFEFLGNGSLLTLPFPVFIVAGAALATYLVLRKTALGIYIEAVGGNVRAARLCGIPVRTLKISVYVFCAFLAGVAGLIATADIKEADVANCGLYLELDAILAVVIGGTSLAGGRARLGGTILGALIMQTITIMLQMRGVLLEYTLIVKAFVAILVCFLQTPVFVGFLSRVFRREARAHGK